MKLRSVPLDPGGHCIATISANAGVPPANMLRSKSCIACSPFNLTQDGITVAALGVVAAGEEAGLVVGREELAVEEGEVADQHGSS